MAIRAFRESQDVRRFASALSGTSVLLPAPVKGGSKGPILLTTTVVGGEKVLMAFSSEETLRRWKPKGSVYAKMRTTDVLRMFLTHDHDLIIIIDIDGPVACALNKDQVRQILLSSAVGPAPS
jgi:hypothetical protein